jgi:hypothetical protein
LGERGDRLTRCSEAIAGKFEKYVQFGVAEKNSTGIFIKLNAKLYTFAYGGWLSRWFSAGGPCPGAAVCRRRPLLPAVAPVLPPAAAARWRRPIHAEKGARTIEWTGHP